MQVIKKIIVWILTLESRLVLMKYKPQIVAVTGSVGKTSTKDAIYAVMTSPGLCKPGEEGICYVRKSDKSMNSDVGLPLTILGVPNAWHNARGWYENIMVGFSLIFRRHDYPDFLVLEVGADHPGDIRRAAKWLKPHIAVITRVSRTPVHVEFFKSPEEVFAEKATLAKSARNSLVLFADDERVASIGAGQPAKKDIPRYKSIVSFGLNDGASVRGTHYVVMYGDVGTEHPGKRRPIGMVFKIRPDKASAESFEIKVKGIVGEAYMYPLLAACAVGKSLDQPWSDIIKGVNQYDAPKGRMNLIEGVNGSTIIDDTYNSSPDAALAALETLGGMRCDGKKIAILGDMMELGKYSSDEHKKAGALAAKNCAHLITVGQRSRLTAEEAVKSGMSVGSVAQFDSATDAISHAVSLAGPGDIILVKGSQSVRMERIVKALMKEPARAAELLVRQEKEWLEKK